MSEIFIKYELITYLIGILSVIAGVKLRDGFIKYAIVSISYYVLIYTIVLNITSKGL